MRTVHPHYVNFIVSLHGPLAPLQAGVNHGYYLSLGGVSQCATTNKLSRTDRFVTFQDYYAKIFFLLLCLYGLYIFVFCYRPLLKFSVVNATAREINILID